MPTAQPTGPITRCGAVRGGDWAERGKFEGLSTLPSQPSPAHIAPPSPPSPAPPRPALPLHVIPSTGTGKWSGVKSERRRGGRGQRNVVFYAQLVVGPGQAGEGGVGENRRAYVALLPCVHLPRPHPGNPLPSLPSPPLPYSASPPPRLAAAAATWPSRHSTIATLSRHRLKLMGGRRKSPPALAVPIFPAQSPADCGRQRGRPKRPKLPRHRANARV